MNGQEYKIKGWVARDLDGQLCLFQDEKPIKEKKYWMSNGSIGKWMYIDSKTFHELTWEDEPIEVELTIKKI